MYSLLYADDTLLISETEAKDKQRALDVTSKFCIQEKMTMNVSKTKYTAWFQNVESGFQS